ncbi:MAG: flagellar motor protein MotB [Bacteroidetes bacterium]|nr:MAG: flagellar motor protein MotB [Bacteroidota bacterium]
MPRSISTYLLIFVLTALAGACTYTIRIKDGRTAYERKQYDTAIPLLEKEFGKAKTRTEKGQLAFQIADAHRHNGRDAESLKWFSLAYENNYGPEALKGQAYALKKLERYTEAQALFKDLGIEIGSPYEYRKEITACTVAEGWKTEAKDNGWKVESSPFNSSQNDYSPVYYADGRLVFSSDRALSNGDSEYKWTGNKFMDLFIVEPAEASAQIFDGGLNSEGNEGTMCFSPDFTEIVFARAVGAYKGDDQYCKLFIAQRAGDGWGTPRPLPFQRDKINYFHPALSPDGRTLYFSCNDPEGWGGYDLWSVERNEQSESGWGAPKLLSRNINTPGNEVFPSFSGDTLYFSSDGLPGMGGLDIFRTYKTQRNAWASPLNLKPPVNSGADDFGFIAHNAPTRNGPLQPGDLIRTGYFTSNRTSTDSRGGDDIYFFEQRIPPPKPVEVVVEPEPPKEYKMILDGYVLEKIFSDPTDPNSKTLGRKPLEGASVEIRFAGKTQRVGVGADGFFSLELSENTDYSFSASREGYLSNSTRFSTAGIARDPANPVQRFEVEIVLDKIFRNREIVLENIYYDFDKWDIRPDAEPTLNRLANVLQQNPDINIQLGSHTDCRGNDDYNESLSQKRAQSAVNYLISKGIATERLSAVGYGESQPAVSCACNRCTESEHQANRRTTFKIVE